MKGMKSELVVGIFSIIALAVLAFMTFRVGDIVWFREKGYIVYVHFKNTSGLDEKTKIKVAGVDAGTIEKIDLADGMAKVTVRMDPDVKLYSDAHASIRSMGLLGDKYLEIKIGSVEPAIKDGGTIGNVTEIVDVDDLLRNLTDASTSLSELADELNTTMKDAETKESVKEILANLRETTRELKGTMTDNRQRFNEILRKIDSLTASLDDLVKTNRAPLTNTIASLEKASGEMRAMLQNSRQDIESLTNSASAIANRIDKGEGTIGKLTKDEKLYTALTNTVASLGNAVSAIDRFKFYITLAGDYMPELPGGGDGKGYFYVTLQPRRDKYYILGIVDDPVGSVDTKLTSTDGVTVKEEKVEAGIEFTAQFAKRFGDTAVRAGITENSLGVGVDRFFLDDRMKLSLDGWDFRVDEFRATNPHFRIGADYFLFKHLFVSCGLDNLFNEDSRSVFMGGGVRFLDEDFKYIFGSLPSIPR